MESNSDWGRTCNQRHFSKRFVGGGDSSSLVGAVVPPLDFQSLFAKQTHTSKQAAASEPLSCPCVYEHVCEACLDHVVVNKPTSTPPRARPVASFPNTLTPPRRRRRRRVNIVQACLHARTPAQARTFFNPRANFHSRVRSSVWVFSVCSLAVLRSLSLSCYFFVWIKRTVRGQKTGRPREGCSVRGIVQSTLTHTHGVTRILWLSESW